MSRFHDLTVTDIHKTIRDAVVVSLAPAPGEEDVFAFTPGQYLTFRRDFDGQELRRSYSICSVPGEPLRVGIKRVPGGAFSTWANSELRVGDVLQAMAPAGRFHAGPPREGGRHVLLFAGGSGITPVLSILRHTLENEPDSDVTLVYANRAVSSIMFREELEDLKNAHLERFTLIHVLETDAQEIDLFTGMLDADRLKRLFANWINIDGVDTACICGPEPMMLTIRDSLSQHGLADDRIRFELFASDQPGRAPRPAASAEALDAGEATLAVTLDGTTRTLSAPRDQSILETARAHDMDAPYACKAGVCATCRCKVIEGEVDMIANHALEDYEVEKGYVLSCQSYPLSDKVVVDYDQ